MAIQQRVNQSPKPAPAKQPPAKPPESLKADKEEVTDAEETDSGAEDETGAETADETAKPPLKVKTPVAVAVPKAANSDLVSFQVFKVIDPCPVIGKTRLEKFCGPKMEPKKTYRIPKHAADVLYDRGAGNQVRD